MKPGTNVLVPLPPPPAQCYHEARRGGLQRAVPVLASVSDFWLTLAANTPAREPTIAANEPTFRLLVERLSAWPNTYTRVVARWEHCSECLTACAQLARAMILWRRLQRYL
jgi:hypothetical protein